VKTIITRNVAFLGVLEKACPNVGTDSSTARVYGGNMETLIHTVE
jgi:hypothetical protein